jgi:hypothetical protein
MGRLFYGLTRAEFKKLAHDFCAEECNSTSFSKWSSRELMVGGIY